MSNITNISGGMNVIHWDTMKSSTEAQNQQGTAHSVPTDVVDSVQMRAASMEPTLIADEDVDSVLEQTTQMISDDPYAALHVHSGLDASRVAALLA